MVINYCWNTKKTVPLTIIIVICEWLLIFENRRNKIKDKNTNKHDNNYYQQYYWLQCYILLKYLWNVSKLQNSTVVKSAHFDVFFALWWVSLCIVTGWRAELHVAMLRAIFIVRSTTTLRTPYLWRIAARNVAAVIIFSYYTYKKQNISSMLFRRRSTWPNAWRSSGGGVAVIVRSIENNTSARNRAGYRLANAVLTS